MSNKSWLVKKAVPEDAGRWFAFASTVTEDFLSLDLVNDEGYHSVMIKNISRGTALYIEDDSLPYCPIIGGLTYSPNQNHISWLAVHHDYRRKRVGSALLEYMFGLFKCIE